MLIIKILKAIKNKITKTLLPFILLITFIFFSFTKDLNEDYTAITTLESIDIPNDLLQNNKVPKNIVILLKSSCYNCHSNETKSPWYAAIAPLKWEDKI